MYTHSSKYTAKVYTPYRQNVYPPTPQTSNVEGCRGAKKVLKNKRFKKGLFDEKTRFAELVQDVF
jgi:hypothetical protein